jgi:hypothetical protein
MVSDRDPSHIPGNQGYAANEPRLEDELVGIRKKVVSLKFHYKARI